MLQLLMEMSIKWKSKRATAYREIDAPQSRVAAKNMRIPGTDELRIATLNVGTMSGKSGEVVDFMKRRRCRILCVQETKWKGDRARVFGEGYKLLHAGGDGKSNGVGVIVDSNLARQVIRVERWDGRIMMVWMLTGGRKLCVMTVYAPQVGRNQREKREFREKVEDMLQLVEEDDILCMAGDFNAHIGKQQQGEEESVGRFGYGERNIEGKEWVHLASRNGLAVAQTYCEKRPSHKITFSSGGRKSEIDWLVMKRTQRWRVKDCKVIAGEHVTTQHKPLVWILRFAERRERQRIGRKVIRWWKCEGKKIEEYEKVINRRFKELSEEPEGVEEEWRNFRQSFVGEAEKLVGRTTGKGGARRKQQWWWTKEMETAVRTKRAAWKAVEEAKNDPQRKEQLTKNYRIVKNQAKKVVGLAKMEAERKLYEAIDHDSGRKLVYRLAKARDRESKDIIGTQGVRKENGAVVVEENQVLKTWKIYFEDLLNTEEENDIEEPSSVRGCGSGKEIQCGEVQLALKRMKPGKAVGSDEMSVEMVRAAGQTGIAWLVRIFKVFYEKGKIPDEWRLALIVPIWKGKGSVQDPRKYRGITLISQVQKVFERVLVRRLTEQIGHEIGEEQQGFRKGRSVADGMFVVRQLIEKTLERDQCMAFGFVDLEKAYDTVPRRLVMSTLRWLEVEEDDVKIIENMYDNTRAAVVLNTKRSEEFMIRVGLRQGSALSPLLFTLVMELISRKSSETQARMKMLYADDLAVAAMVETDLERRLQEWDRNFRKHGLRMSLEKTEVMSVGKQRKDLEVNVRGATLKQVGKFVYLGGMVSEDGKGETEVRRRIQAGVGAYRKVAGVMGDRKIGRGIRRKVLEACVIPALTYGLETMALTEKQQKTIQVCENNWIRRLCGVKLVEKRRLAELRKEVGLKKTVTQKMVEKRLNWAGHVVRMGGERVVKQVEEMDVMLPRKRGRPSIRWRDCIKRDLTGAGEDWSTWREKAKDREKWRQIVTKAADCSSD